MFGWSPSFRCRQAVIALLCVLTAMGACDDRGGGTAARPAPASTAGAAVDGQNAGPAEAGGPAVNAPTTVYSAVPQRSATLDQLPRRHLVAPVAVRIAAGGISAPVVGVSTDSASGDLAVPPSPGTVAWYQHGPAPDEPGSTVLAAHVDWQGQPGAFFTLATVPVGADAVVTLEDGRAVRYTVTSQERVGKAELPINRIFAREGPPQLVLVTCGGDFDRDAHRYADNVVVFATRAEP